MWTKFAMAVATAADPNHRLKTHQTSQAPKPSQPKSKNPSVANTLAKGFSCQQCLPTLRAHLAPNPSQSLAAHPHQRYLSQHRCGILGVVGSRCWRQEAQETPLGCSCVDNSCTAYLGFVGSRRYLHHRDSIPCWDQSAVACLRHRHVPWYLPRNGKVVLTTKAACAHVQAQDLQVVSTWYSRCSSTLIDSFCTKKT
jgi:hypothetical protein